jgi:hypothetical protein
MQAHFLFISVFSFRKSIFSFKKNYTELLDFILFMKQIINNGGKQNPIQKNVIDLANLQNE